MQNTTKLLIPLILLAACMAFCFYSSDKIEGANSQHHSFSRPSSEVLFALGGFGFLSLRQRRWTNVLQLRSD